MSEWIEQSRKVFGDRLIGSARGVDDRTEWWQSIKVLVALRKAMSTSWFSSSRLNFGIYVTCNFTAVINGSKILLKGS